MVFFHKSAGKTACLSAEIGAPSHGRSPGFSNISNRAEPPLPFRRLGENAVQHKEAVPPALPAVAPSERNATVAAPAANAAPYWGLTIKFTSRFFTRMVLTIFMPSVAF